MWTVNPWRRLRALTHVGLGWHQGGPRGLTFHAAQVVSIRRGLTWEQRRCTLMHELLHVERGPVTAALRLHEEAQVRRATARLMLPDVRAVGDALAWATDLHETAHDLWVDVETLRDRLTHLHPAERHYLSRRLDDEAI